jgi:hypothetical protein
VIAACGAVVAHLGGWRGDQLFVARDEEELRPVAELGWDPQRQATPQRRLRVTANEIFVLEPAAGPLLVPPLRVRRFSFDGRETGREEGADESDSADLYFLAERTGPGPVRVRRAGLDPATGRPLFREGTLEVDLMHHERYCSGVPLAMGGAWWYPVREEGLVRAGPAGVEVARGHPAPLVERVGERAVCAGTRRGRPGAWVDGAWHAVAGRPLFPSYRFPRLGLAAAGRGTDIVLLRRDGGALPVLGTGSARLDPGGAPYTGLVAVPAGLRALAEAGGPRLVPVEL